MGKTASSATSRFFQPRKRHRKETQTIDLTETENEDESKPGEAIARKDDGSSSDQSTASLLEAQSWESTPGEAAICKDAGSSDNDTANLLQVQSSSQSNVEQKEHIYNSDGLQWSESLVEEDKEVPSVVEKETKSVSASFPVLSFVEDNPTSNDQRESHASPKEMKSLNPFAKFAFKSTFGGQERSQGSSSASSAHWVIPANKKKTGRNATDISSNGDKTKKTKEYVRMKDLSHEEQQRVTSKWLSLADPNAELEAKRFQVLVGARLHARCQDSVVRQTMLSLRTNLGADQFTVDTIAQLDPENLAPVLKSLQYYNTKAQHIVKASNEIKDQFGGIVPESEEELRKLTGIGPALADLLSFVNTREKHGSEL